MITSDSVDFWQYIIANFYDLQLDINAVDSSGCNAVHYAAESCQTYLVYKLVCAGTAKLLTTVNNEGKTPVNIAKDHPKLEWVLKPIRYGMVV